MLFWVLPDNELYSALVVKGRYLNTRLCPPPEHKKKFNLRYVWGILLKKLPKVMLGLADIYGFTRIVLLELIMNTITFIAFTYMYRELLV